MPRDGDGTNKEWAIRRVVLNNMSCNLYTPSLSNDHDKKVEVYNSVEPKPKRHSMNMRLDVWTYGILEDTLQKNTICAAHLFAAFCYLAWCAVRCSGMRASVKATQGVACRSSKSTFAFSNMSQPTLSRQTNSAEEETSVPPNTAL